MDTLGALALATEPPHEGLMKRPPIGRDAAFITRIMWRNIIGQSIYQLIVLAILKFDGKRLLKLSGSDATAVLNTVIFNTFVFCQVLGLDLYLSFPSLSQACYPSIYNVVSKISLLIFPEDKTFAE